MDLTNLLTQSGVLEQLAKQYGLNSDQVAEVIKMGLPKMSDAINKNTSTKEGLDSFMGALKDHKNDDVDSMIDNLDNVDAEDGSKIIGHIFGDKRQETEAELSQMQGLSMGTVSGILSKLAPIILGMLGSQLLKGKAAAGSSNRNITDSFLGKESMVTKVLKSFLDKDHDGSIIDDILGKIF